MSDRLRLQPKVTAILRNQVCISQKGDVCQNIHLFIEMSRLFLLLIMFETRYSFIVAKAQKIVQNVEGKNT